MEVQRVIKAHKGIKAGLAEDHRLLKSARDALLEDHSPNENPGQQTDHDACVSEKPSI
jgi:hypothetical protein